MENLNSNVETLVSIAWNDFLFDNKLNFKNVYNYEYEMEKLGYSKDEIHKAVEVTYEKIRTAASYNAEKKKKEESLKVQDEAMSAYYKKYGTTNEF